MTKKVFLGGTVNNSFWREELIPQLDSAKISYFNPVVEDWTPECQAEEIQQRQTCDFLLYIISKEMKGIYSIAEAVDDSNKQPEKTIFCYLPEGFGKHEIKALQAAARIISGNGVKVFTSLQEAAEYLNSIQEVESRIEISPRRSFW